MDGRSRHRPRAVLWVTTLWAMNLDTILAASMTSKDEFLRWLFLIDYKNQGRIIKFDFFLLEGIDLIYNSFV